jgi:hypothetical protein
MEPADLPIVGRLFIRDGSSALVDDFYTELEHLRAKKATHEKLVAESGKLAEGEDSKVEKRAEKYQLTEKENAKLRSMERVSRNITELRKQYRDAKTREERKAVWTDMLELVKVALDVEEEP